MFTMCCFVGYCAMVTSCKALLFHPLQLHWFMWKLKEGPRVIIRRRSEVQYIKYIAWGTLQEMSPGVTVLILYIKKKHVSNLPYEKNSCKTKIIIDKGIIVKIVIFHAPHCYIFLLSSGPLLCVRSVWRDPGGKEFHGILPTVPPSCRGTVLLVNLDILYRK